MMKLLFILSLAVGYNSYSQTCIIAIKTDSEIVVGADSRVIHVSHDNGVDSISYFSMCKIRKAANIFFAISGSVDDIFYEIAEQSCIISHDIHGVDSIYIKKVLDTLSNKLEVLRINAPIQFDRFVLQHGASGLSIFFFNFQGNKPAINTINFTVTSKVSEKVKIIPQEIVDDELPDNSRQIDYRIIGITAGIEKLPNQDLNNIFRIGDKRAAVNILIKQEIADDSSEVGEPINIVRLTKTTCTWTPEPNICNR